MRYHHAGAGEASPATLSGAGRHDQINAPGATAIAFLT